jgi:hypothetical protein
LWQQGSVPAAVATLLAAFGGQPLMHAAGGCVCLCVFGD